MAKRLLEINAVPYGSTGKIIRGIAEIASKEDIETYIYYGWTKGLRRSHEGVMVGSFLGKILHMAFGKLTGFAGCFSLFDTLKLISFMKHWKPDVIHLHLLHCWYINLPILFSYIKKNNIKVLWTMHDCWAITGQCPHFTMIQCDKWKSGCHNCPQIHDYPDAYVDQTRTMWKYKKKWFTGVKDLTLITPSEWLADLVKISFLKEYPVKVINNGIDLTIFKPTPSDFRAKYGISSDKRIVLGVAFGWGVKKGLDVFLQILDSSYQIVLVGTDDTVDCQLPSNIISIHRTSNQTELAKIYTAADVFANPTREEVLGLVNIESLACGTPVVTFRTGGSPEVLDDTCGVVVQTNQTESLADAIIQVCERKGLSSEACVIKGKEFDMNHRFGEYVNLINTYCE